MAGRGGRGAARPRPSPAAMASAPAPRPPAARLGLRAHTSRARAHTHTLTHRRAHTKGRSHILAGSLARARPRGGGGGAGGEDARPGRRRRRRRRPFRAPAPISSRAPLARALLSAPPRPPTKWGRRASPRPSGRTWRPRAKFGGGGGGRGAGPARARARAGAPQLCTGPGVKRTDKQAPGHPRGWRRGGEGWGGRRWRRQEWLLSLILVYSEKLQTGRVQSEQKRISGPKR